MTEEQPSIEFDTIARDWAEKIAVERGVSVDRVGELSPLVRSILTTEGVLSHDARLANVRSALDYGTLTMPHVEARKAAQALETVQLKEVNLPKDYLFLLSAVLLSYA